MKKLVLMSFMFLLGISSVMAQETKDNRLEDSDYVILLNEKVFHYTFDGVEALKGTLKLNNGAVVKEDGTYIVGDKSMKLKDGECLGMSGKKYKSQLELSKKLRKEMKKK